MTDPKYTDLAEALRNHATYFTDVIDVTRIAANRYLDGNPGLYATILWNDEGMEYPEDTQLSINLAGYGMTPPPGHVFVKDYSEHEGMATALEVAGIVTKVKQVPIGYSKGWLVKVNTDKVEDFS